MMAKPPFVSVVMPVRNGNEHIAAAIDSCQTALGGFVSGCWYCPGSTVLVARDTLIDIGGFDPKLRRLEDLDLFIRLAANGGKLAFAPLFGANVRKGQNARRRDVDPAAAQLRQKYLAQNSPVLNANVGHRLDSWLAVEEAAAAFNDGDRLRGVTRMIRSVFLVPRLRIQLEDWWNTD